MNNSKKARKAYKKAQKAYNKAFKGINVKENEAIVLKCKTSLCYDFALNIPGADIKAHEKVILDLKDLFYCFHFAYSIPEANIEEHFKVILNSGDKYWLEDFIEKVNYKDTKVEEWVMHI